MKHKVKRYAEGKEVEIEERSIKTPRLIEEEKAKAPMDYAGLGGRARAISTWSGAPAIKEETTTETETPTAPSARASDEESVAGKGARNLALEKPEIKVKEKTVIKKKKPKYEDTGAKIGSQDFRMKPPVPESTSGFGPKLSFLTKERLEKSREAMRSARGMKAGGSASSRGDGIAQRGKTKGRIC